MIPRSLRLRPFVLPCLLLLLGAGCHTTRKLADPTLEIAGPLGQELGVGTEYGVVFLGRSGQSGEVDITAWFGDGPSIESSLIESIGGGLYTAATEIRLPGVPLSFSDPEPGARLLIRGRHGEETWTEEVEVQRHPKVTGLLLPIPDRLDNAPDQVGAGVYLPGPKRDDEGFKLIGLVSGILELTEGGRVRRYLTVVGARDLWRLVAYRRDLSYKSRWVYREDVL